MTDAPGEKDRRPSAGSRRASPSGSAMVAIALMLLFSGACSSMRPAEHRSDPAAEAMLARLRQLNAGLVQFKCIGKIYLFQPDEPKHSFRAAMAGRLDDRLRIDLLAPFGGAAGTVASDGTHLFLVMHPTREYYKKRYGDGSLRRFIHMDITVNDLLELLVGRIPLSPGMTAHASRPEEGALLRVDLVDRWGRLRQQIDLDEDGIAKGSIWFDGDRKPVLQLHVGGHRTIDSYLLPSRIDLSAANGQRVSVSVDRYDVNAHLDDGLFAPPPL